MLTVPDAARLLGRNPETIRRWIREGKLPATKIGTQHVIDEDDLALVGAEPPRRPRVAEAVAAYGSNLPALVPVAGRGNSWLPAIVGRIVHLVDPVRIVLFGSPARGDAREDSDYDILVIVQDVPNRRAMRIAIGRALDDLPISKDIVVVPLDEVTGVGPDRPRGVVHWALVEGCLVYERR